MVNVERSELGDVFFDSLDVLSIGEQETELQIWSNEPVSVEQRREQFLKKMGLLEYVPVEETSSDDSDLTCLDRIKDQEETVTSSSDSSVSENEFECCGRDENYGFTNSESEERSRVSMAVPWRNFSKKTAKKWLFKCFAGRTKDEDVKIKDNKLMISKVKVKINKKSHEELSATYKIQEINGHKGTIWAMKFSPDGKYLATGGEDGIIRIWRITSSESLCAEFLRQEQTAIKNQEQEQEQPLILFPHKAFHVEEKPFQELHGHTGGVLDLAWSNSNVSLLLSASKDKTVRLWRITSNQCIHVFHHNNYVTCVEFNPMNKNYFISGSIDGKARIWGVSEERVVAWSDVHDAISAICYKTDGKGFVVGCITGTCRFYQISGNDVVMEEQILIRGRKRGYNSNRITALQFCPGSSDKIMVSSDDSKLRIYNRTQILHKFKASKKFGSQSSASFISSAGKQILSLRRGHGIYLWNNDCRLPTKKRAKTSSSRSFEYFHSRDVSTAAAWYPPGTELVGDVNEPRRIALKQVQCSGSLTRSCRVTATWPEEKLLTLKDPNTVTNGDIYDNTLPISECDLGGAWRLVIVTASLDGVIRTFHNYGLPRRL